MKIAKVKTITSGSEVLVPITGEDKPDISEEMQIKWQKILDLAAKIIGVPSGLITRLSEKQLEVFLSSKTENNIFEPHLKLDLGAGWYCENVAGTRNDQIIPNALKIDEWKENPSIPFNIIAYLGIPILWPDGEVFGTFCMLDNKENPYSELYKDLLKSLREIIHNDLNNILLYQKAQNEIMVKNDQIREIHHRVKNHFNLLISTLNMHSLLDSHNQSEEELLHNIQSRIYAISAVHDKLYFSSDFEEIKFGNYLDVLGKYLINNLSDKKIIYECTWDDVYADQDTSMRCGVILNELIINSIKYAFKEKETPLISLLVKNNNQEITIIYKDNGIGIAEKYNINATDSLGMLLIMHNASQLHAKCQFFNDSGFVFKMSFPLK